MRSEQGCAENMTQTSGFGPGGIKTIPSPLLPVPPESLGLSWNHTSFHLKSIMFANCLLAAFSSISEEVNTLTSLTYRSTQWLRYLTVEKQWPSLSKWWWQPEYCKYKSLQEACFLTEAVSALIFAELNMCESLNKKKQNRKEYTPFCSYIPRLSPNHKAFKCHSKLLKYIN